MRIIRLILILVIRVKELFDIIVEYPSSEAALLDLKTAMNIIKTSGQRKALVDHLIQTQVKHTTYSIIIID